MGHKFLQDLGVESKSYLLFTLMSLQSKVIETLKKNIEHMNIWFIV